MAVISPRLAVSSLNACVTSNHSCIVKLGRLLYHDNDDSDSDIDCENLINLSKFINKYDADTNRALKIFTLLIATKKGFFDMECFNDVSVKLIPNVLRLAQRFVEGNAC